MKICQEEGLKKGSEVFGEFGGQIGVEAALQFGKKAGVAKLKELVMEHAVEMGKAAGKEAGKPPPFIIFIESQCTLDENPDISPTLEKAALRCTLKSYHF